MEPRIEGAHARDEQLNGACVLCLRRRGGRGQGEGAEAVDVLVGMTKQFLAGGEDMDARRVGAQRGDHGVDGLEQVLAVVEDEEKPLMRRRIDEAFQRRRRVADRQANRSPHRQRDKPGVRQRRELHHADAVGEMRLQRIGGCLRQPCLADTAGTDHGDERMLLNHKDIVTGNAFSRQFPVKPVVGTFDLERPGRVIHKLDYAKDALQPVDSCGMAFTLISRRALEKVGKNPLQRLTVEVVEQDFGHARRALHLHYFILRAYRRNT